MGIYDNKSEPKVKLKFRFGFSKKKLKYPAILIVGLIAIVLAFFAVQTLMQPQAIMFSLSPNPLDLARNQTSLLTVDVFNVTGANAENAVLDVSAVASELFVITPESQSISTIEAGGRREYLFQIRPFNNQNPTAGVPAGDYKLQIILNVNGEKFTKEAILQIKRVS
ncbi:MAG: hypothetical protein JW772_03930 [Candidatus Diapherotrites archaeon]|nr:hypothetical protein [Candidatus Diapherotrites archaeon]